MSYFKLCLAKAISHVRRWESVLWNSELQCFHIRDLEFVFWLFLAVVVCQSIVALSIIIEKYLPVAGNEVEIK